MNRRSFVQSGFIATLGLVLGPEALEAYERLTWKRRLFPGLGRMAHTTNLPQVAGDLAAQYQKMSQQIYASLDLYVPSFTKLKASPPKRLIVGPDDGLGVITWQAISEDEYE